jgi:hypothetical protein
VRSASETSQKHLSLRHMARRQKRSPDPEWTQAVAARTHARTASPTHYCDLYAAVLLRRTAAQTSPPAAQTSPPPHGHARNAWTHGRWQQRNSEGVTAGAHSLTDVEVRLLASLEWSCQLPPSRPSEEDSPNLESADWLEPQVASPQPTPEAASPTLESAERTIIEWLKEPPI